MARAKANPRFDDDTEQAIKAAEAAKREEALAFDTPLPEGDGPFYIARPRGRVETRREIVPGDNGGHRTVINDYFFTAFYGPFETHKDVIAYLNVKRSRGSENWTNAIRVVNQAEARRIKTEEEGDPIVG